MIMTERNRTIRPMQLLQYILDMFSQGHSRSATTRGQCQSKADKLFTAISRI